MSRHIDCRGAMTTRLALGVVLTVAEAPVLPPVSAVVMGGGGFGGCRVYRRQGGWVTVAASRTPLPHRPRRRWP